MLGKKVIIGIVLALFLAGFGAGYAWAKKAQAEKETVQAEADTKEVERQKEVVVETVIKYVDRVRTIEVKGDDILKEVFKYVPNDDCVVTPDAVRLLNVAAENLPLPGTPGDINGSPGPARNDLIKCATLAHAVSVTVKNYEQYHKLAAQTEALQSFIRDTGKHELKPP